MEKNYNPLEIETKWNNNYYSFITSKEGLNIYSFNYIFFKKSFFSILMPPPNITGVLHLGHALFITIQDILIRYNKILKNNVFWISGLDHAGIATQIVVEKFLYNEKKKTLNDLSKEEFLNFISIWKDQKSDYISNQFKRLSSFIDFKFLNYTMSEKYQESVYKAFSLLWKNRFIYRSKKIVNYDIKLKTAISDEEIENLEKKNFLWTIKYNIYNSNNQIEVATTRPETIFADTALAVNPNDHRYFCYKNNLIIHPIYKDRLIPLIFDKRVDPNYGTGVLKITPAHSLIDYNISLDHKLQHVSIMNFDGSLKNNCSFCSGLFADKARIKILHFLKKKNKISNKTTITNIIPVSQRTGSLIEPILSSQYFIDMKSFSLKMLKYFKNNFSYIFPKHSYKNIVFFLENIRDWCISRQIQWGHRIPISYDFNILKLNISKKFKNINFNNDNYKNILNNFSDKTIKNISILSREKLSNKNNLFLDESDVLDTWFSSSLFSFCSLNWNDKHFFYKIFYPNSFLDTGHDIIFFWVTRMLIMGLFFTGFFPFNHVYLHGILRDTEGKKISKSSGNSIDYLDLINGIKLDEFIAKSIAFIDKIEAKNHFILNIKKNFPNGISESGSDSLRLSLSFFCNLSLTIKFNYLKIFNFKFFLNKVWNFSRFFKLNINFDNNFKDFDFNIFYIEDKWIFSKFYEFIFLYNNYIKSYNFSKCVGILYSFFKLDLCDFYLEIVKIFIKKKFNNNVIKIKFKILSYIFYNFLLFFHPFCPCLTDEIFNDVFSISDFCFNNSILKYNKNFINIKSVIYIDFLKNIIILIRRLRKDLDIPYEYKLFYSINIFNHNVFNFYFYYSFLTEKFTNSEIIFDVLLIDSCKSKNFISRLDKDFKVNFYFFFLNLDFLQRINKKIEKFIFFHKNKFHLIFDFLSFKTKIYEFKKVVYFVKNGT